MSLGYTKKLFILPFDHRSSFLKKMFGIEGRQPTDEEIQLVASYKYVVYNGFKLAVTSGDVPKTGAAILVDEQLGDAVLRDAKHNGYTTCLSTEKSGQDEFDFEYGDSFGQHIDTYRPTFVKALIRYNPESDPELNKRQQGRLKTLTDFCHTHDYKFLIEPLVPATPDQLTKVDNDSHRYDHELRPGLMVKMVQELQAGGVEPDIWKIEGFDQATDYQTIINQMRSSGRDQVSAIVLGRGADDSQVERWLKAGASVDGVIGFAVGRTIFWQALVDYKENKLTAEQAATEIGRKYAHFYKVFSNT